ncbi:MAG: hypothetical protein HC841_06570 [Verrucomicrobiae bacterium]|nr:hypothetical protein [Verrucomicrobiae bacterium]
MATASISKIMSELFTAPLDAVVNSEAEYRRIWVRWLRERLELVTEKAADGTTRLREGVNVAGLLTEAPAVSLDGVVEMSITMRIASVKQREGSLGIGVALAPAQVSGSFGFMSRTAEESVFQAQARFTLSNTERNLASELAGFGLKPADIASLENAMKLLSTTPPPAKPD